MIQAVDVISVTKEDNVIRVVQELTDDLGNKSFHLHLFRDDTIEWRAAEYGFDPDTEFDDIVDLILYEPHFPQGYKQLHEYDTQEEARQAMMLMVTEAKTRLMPENDNRPASERLANIPDKSYVSDEAPGQALRNHSLMGKEELALKREYVGKIFEKRREIKARGEVSPQGDKGNTPRGAALRAQLTPPKETGRKKQINGE